MAILGTHSEQLPHNSYFGLLGVKSSGLEPSLEQALAYRFQESARISNDQYSLVRTYMSVADIGSPNPVERREH